MAATVVDELVVILGLDSSKFTEGQKKVAEEFVRLKANAERATKGAQDHTESLTKAFSTLQGKLLGIAALFLGGMGIKQFGEHVAQLTTQLGRLSQQAGISASELSAWGNAGAAAGANAGAVRAGVQGLAAAGNQVEPNTQLYQTLAAMGVSPRRLPNGDFDVNGTLMSMSEWAQQRRAQGWGSGRITGMLMRVPGMNPDLATTVEQGPDQLRAMLTEMKKFGPTPEQVAAVQTVNKAWAELQAKMEQTARIIETQLAPVLTKIIKIIEDFVGVIDNRAKEYKSPQDAAKALHDQLNKPIGASPGSPWSRWMKGLGNWWRGTGNLTDDSAHASTPPAQQPGVNGAPTVQQSNISIGAQSTRTAQAKAAAMQQLRAEGVPEANLNAAASALVGQATAESGLNPNTVHDSGTGYGVYGARNERMTRMLSWLHENGFAKNSLEGQMKYMAHEAMSQRYQRSRSALMGATPENLGGVNRVLTDSFESPLIRNYGARMGATNRALREHIASDDAIWGTHGSLSMGAAAQKLNVMGNSTSTTTSSHTTNQTHVGEVNVYPPNGSPHDIAKGIYGALTNVNPVAQANTGPW